MRWNFLSLDESGPLSCTVCGRLLPDTSIANGDFLYYPHFEGDSDEHLATAIKRIWHVDPYSGFANSAWRDIVVPFLVLMPKTGWRSGSPRPAPHQTLITGSPIKERTNSAGKVW